MIAIIDPFITEGICTNFRLLGPIALILLVLVLPISKKQLYKLEKPFNQLAQRKPLSVFLVGTLAFIGTLMVSYFFYWPIPVTHDEFSYLLASDTFAHGRLTNPTHPMWIHFETFYILSQPTYMSLYQPGQGLILALGQVLIGQPVVGIWLSIALACASLCWMLQGWMPARWALLGGLLMILKLGLFTYWSSSFWGGALAATGGALVLGSLRRIIKEPKMFYSMLLALGLGILANSRPYEGLLVTLPAMLYLLIWMKGKKSPKFNILLKEVILPLLGVLLLIGAFMAYYNWAITGKPWVMPYQLYQSTYATVSNFLWSKPRPAIQYNHEEFRNMYQDWFFDLYKSNVGILKYVSFSLEKIQNLASFFLGASFLLMLVVLPLLRKNFWVRFALLSLFIMTCGMLVILANFPHYAAPGVCLLYFLVLQSMRRIYFFCWQKRPIGRLIIWSIPLHSILLILLTLGLGQDPFAFVAPGPWDPTRTLESHWSFQRNDLLLKLKAEQGKHLVIVSYLPDKHNPHNEWVFNEADIDNSKVVWARNMKAEKNCDLIKYFQDRKIWFLQIDETAKPVFIPYPVSTCP